MKKHKISANIQGVSVNMEKTLEGIKDITDVDTGTLDKECVSLAALFQQIINEMKVRDILNCFTILSMITI